MDDAVATKRCLDALSTSQFGWAGDVTAAQHDPVANVASASPGLVHA